MATSNSTNYNQTRDEISADTLRLLGIITKSETPEQADLDYCSNQLNKMIKGWEAKGIHVWAQSEALIPLISGVNEYVIDGTINTNVGGDLAHNTTISSTSSGTALTLTDVSWANVGDYVSVTLDDESRQVSTISSIVGNTCTIDDSLLQSASTGNNVCVFTNLIGRPLNINSARYRYNSGIDRPMEQQDRTTFMMNPNKSSTGPSNVFFYTPQLNNGRLYVWPTPDNSNDMLDISYQRKLEDFDSGTDNPDLPSEWLEAIQYNLAMRIAPSYGIALSKENPDIISIAGSALMDLQSWDFGEGSIMIAPGYRYD